MEAQKDIEHLDPESQYQFDEFVAALESEAATEARRDHDPAQLLTHPHPKARLAGAMMCYDRQSPELKRILVERLMLEGHPFVRASLVKALRHYPEAPVIELMAECLLDPDPRVRSNTVEALMQYEHPSLFKRISQLLKDPDNSVRGTVLIYMGKRFPEKIRPLVESMSASASSWTRRTARYVHEKLGWTPPAEPPRSESAQEVLAMFSDGDYKTRIQGVWRASQLERDERASLIRDQLDKETHPHVIATLTRALGSAGQTEHISVLSRFLDSKDARVRANTVEGVGRIGGTAALHLIEPLVRDPNTRVRAAAVLYLGKLKRQRHQELLRKLLDTKSREDLTAVLLEMSRMTTEDSGRIVRVLSQAWDADRRRAMHGPLMEISLHGAGQDLVDRLRVLCRETPRVPESAALVPRGAAGDLPGSGPRVRPTGVALSLVPREMTEADHVLLAFGAEVLRDCETGEVPCHGLIADIAAIQRTEESLAQGVRAPECSQLRQQLLIKLGRKSMGMTLRGELDSPKLRQRVESLRSTVGDGGLLPFDANPSGAVTGPPSWLQPNELGRGLAPVGPKGPRSLSRRVKAGMAIGVLSVVMVLGWVHQSDILSRWTENSTAAAPPATSSAHTGRTDRVADSPVKRETAVVRTGRLVEIRNDGLWLVCENGSQHFVVQFAHYSPLEPKIGQLLRVDGSLSGKDVDGRELIFSASFKESVQVITSGVKPTDETPLL